MKIDIYNDKHIVVGQFKQCISEKALLIDSEKFYLKKGKS